MDRVPPCSMLSGVMLEVRKFLLKSTTNILVFSAKSIRSFLIIRRDSKITSMTW